jgi:hypothetical protein
MKRRVYDCFLYNGEVQVLEIRLHELADVVYRFVLVESDATFRGVHKTPAFNPLDPRITPFAGEIRYVLVKDMPRTGDQAKLEAWQRNAILRGVPDAAAEDLVLVSNVDEIPRAIAVKQMVADDQSRIFGLQLACYRFSVDYPKVAKPDSAIIAAARRAEFSRVAPHELRHDVLTGRVPARFLSGAGWHFAGLLDDAGVRREITSFPDVGLSNYLRSIKILAMGHLSDESGERTGRSVRKTAATGTLRALFTKVVSPARWRGGPKRPPGFGSERQTYRNSAGRWEIVDPNELPSWLRANREALPRPFSPCQTIAHVKRAFVPHFIRLLRSRTAATPPVIICPFVRSHEATEISAKFGLQEPRGRKLEFFLWQDTDGIGPERAFQHCWDQFPDRDIVILHSDMAPMPNDLSNRWYDALLYYRNKLPQAGMLACNLFYPRAGPGEPWRVQCAGGTFREGQIGYLRGVVQKAANATAEGVPAAALRKVRAVDWVTFGGVLIRREVIRVCGPFDDRYRWAYAMDVDYCFEARIRGFRLFQVPVSVQHEENQTTRPFLEADSKYREYLVRNMELLYEKWRPFATVLAPN